jgi:hypothetical protein
MAEIREVADEVSPYTYTEADFLTTDTVIYTYTESTHIRRHVHWTETTDRKRAETKNPQKISLLNIRYRCYFKIYASWM